MNEATKAPWHLWVAGIVSLLWNSFGAWDYIQTKSENREYLGMMEDTMGVSVDTAIAYFQAFPLWANLAWGFGVWASVAGSILLLLRSRHAALAFIISAAGFIGGMFYQMSNPIEGTSSMTSMYVMSGVIFAALVLLWYYAKRQTAAGVLR